MNILIRLLYLFQSLTVHIPDTQFRTWDKQISRLRYITLQLLREKGGMALLCLKDYYLAAQLRTLILWCNAIYEANWKNIELSPSARPGQSLLGCPSTIKELPDIRNKCVGFSLCMWLDFVKKLQIQKDIKVLKWLAYDPNFKPATQDLKYKQWIRHGITSYSSLAKNGDLIDLQSV